MTNMAVELALHARGVKLERAKVGDRYVLEALARHHWLLGGESSGHLLVLDRQTTGDGLVSALQVLQYCARSEQSMAQLLSGLTLFPQVLLNVRVTPGQDWRNNQHLVQETQAVEAELGASGRVLIRPSGTEPVLRIMVEAADPNMAHRCAERLSAAARMG